MKIKHKIIVLFAIIIGVVIGLGIIATNYVTDHYIHYKYDNAYEYYYTQGLSTIEFSEYLIEEGFIVTEQEIPEYKSVGNISCHIEDDQIVVYEDNRPVLYAVLNENIVTDLNQLLLYAAIVINFLVIAMLIIIYAYFNKNILFKLNKLETEMSSFKAVESFAIAETTPINEIDILTQEFYKMANMIKTEDKQKKLLIMTLSHELKNPISNIEAVLDMNNLGIEPYNDNHTMNELITAQVEKMKSIVIDLLSAYKDEISQAPQAVDIVTKVKQVVATQQLPTSNLIFDYDVQYSNSLEIKEKVFEHIISNIITNIYKYSLEGSVVSITFNQNQIRFENIRAKKVDNKSTEIGLILNQYLGNELGLRIDNIEKNQRYITIIDY